METIKFIGVFTYDADEDCFWISPIIEGSTLVQGTADLYKVPEQLRRDMLLDNLINKLQ